jgi:hypothetical protein
MFNAYKHLVGAPRMCLFSMLPHLLLLLRHYHLLTAVAHRTPMLLLAINVGWACALPRACYQRAEGYRAVIPGEPAYQGLCHQLCAGRTGHANAVSTGEPAEGVLRQLQAWVVSKLQLNTPQHQHVSA